MVMARKKKEKEKDILDQILDTIDFRGVYYGVNDPLVRLKMIQ